MPIYNTLPATTTSPNASFFSSTGTWVAPAGVTYAIAHMASGGGGAGGNNVSGSQGGQSSALGISAPIAAPGYGAWSPQNQAQSASANTGSGGNASGHFRNNTASIPNGRSSQLVSVGATVIPGNSYPIVVGAGGAGISEYGGSGGSGYVLIEWWS
jgi:hypothetical protein